MQTRKNDMKRVSLLFTYNMDFRIEAEKHQFSVRKGLSGKVDVVLRDLPYYLGRCRWNDPA